MCYLVVPGTTLSNSDQSGSSILYDSNLKSHLVAHDLAYLLLLGIKRHHFNLFPQKMKTLLSKLTKLTFGRPVSRLRNI